MDQIELFSHFQNLQNRRKHERLSRRFRMRFSILEDLSRRQAEKDAELVDIGGGGLRFLADERLADGSQLLIALEIPGWRVTDEDWKATSNLEDIGILQVIGIVMWAAPSDRKTGCYEIGLRFTGQLR